ncbi:MAG: hypothetical protein HWE39_04515 [Oceanospirillaceae bacterium]|nr:hypothetical protein [Oceanospirillaceae bacterium]
MKADIASLGHEFATATWMEKTGALGALVQETVTYLQAVVTVELSNVSTPAS